MIVIRRDNSEAKFDIVRIKDAIKKAFEATHYSFTEGMLEMISLRVTADFQVKVKHGKVYLEDIQNSVENVLMDVGYLEVAKAYILYRKQREKLRNLISAKDVGYVSSFLKALFDEDKFSDFILFSKYEFEMSGGKNE